MKFDTKKQLYILLFLVIGITSCREGNSIYDPDYEPTKDDPVITSITPEGGYFGGVDSIIIHGENFAENTDEVTVSFNGEAGTVLSATPTQLGVRPAKVFENNVEVLVSSRGALHFSNAYSYSLSDPIEPIPGYNQSHNSTAITRNTEGDIIFGLQNESGANQGIKIWRTNDEVEDYLPSQSSWQALKVGPDGLVYGVINNRAVYREDEGVIDTKPYIIGATAETYRNIDFGEDSYLWVVGDNEDIIRADISDASIVRFPFSANLRAVRYYDGQLFVGGSFEGSGEGTITQQIWSFDVSNNELTNSQHVLTVEEETSHSFVIQEITFDTDGKMYIGATSGSGIFTWSDNEGLKEFYPGMVRASGFSFTWLDNYLVASITNVGESTRHPIKINILKEGAPYLGTE